jgi:WD40 repeat protein
MRAVAVFVLWCIASLPASAQSVSFDRDIRPILARQCAGCHQPASKQSGLLLTSYADFLKGGTKGPGFVPGKPDESLVLSYLTGKTTPRMPFGAQPLPDDQIDLFRRWIADGARDDSTAKPPGTPAVERKPTVYKAPPLITALAWSPDGKLLAVSGYHEVLLHGDTGIVGRLAGLASRIHGIVFTPDGSTLVAAGGDPAQFGEVQIWDVAARKQRHSVVLTNDTLFGGSISSDGKMAAFGAADKSIRLFDVTTGREIRKMDHHEDWVFGTAFGVDDKRLVSVGRDRAAKLTNLATGQFVENVNLLKEPLSAIVRHPKRDWVLIGGFDRTPYLYRMDRPRAMRIADDSTLIRKFDAQDGPILALAISPDGQKIAAAAERGPTRVYDIDSGKLVAECSGQEGGTYAVQFHPDSARLAAAGFDGAVRIYDMTGKVVRAFSPVPLLTAASGRE